MVDENWKVKVTDFGLTQITKQGQKLMDEKNGAKGTPLWMAPEVLSGKEFTEASDLYSFGVILWEIYTRSEPYKEFKDYSVFKDHICNQNYREKIPNDCPPRLADLMSKCWHADPSKRPDFAQVLDTIEDILIDITIDDEEGQKFWRQNFKGKVWQTSFCFLTENLIFR